MAEFARQARIGSGAAPRSGHVRVRETERGGEIERERERSAGKVSPLSSRQLYSKLIITLGSNEGAVLVHRFTYLYGYVVFDIVDLDDRIMSVIFDVTLMLDSFSNCGWSHERLSPLVCLPKRSF